MKNIITIVMVAAAALSIFCGCGPQKPKAVGFLSDYSKLQADSDTSFRYFAPGNPLADYDQFIIDPVRVQFYTGSKAIEERSKGKLKDEDITDITNYMHEALVKAIENRYQVVHQPSPGVARVKVALTDLKKSDTLMNILPITKIAGTGLGGASMEAELLDSVTGRQIAAVIQSQLGERLSLDGVSKWGDARAIMDGWARNFRRRLDEAHGY